MNNKPDNTQTRPLGRKYELRRALLLAFCDPLPPEVLTLLTVSEREWRALLHWLDTSGLALYFLDRLEELKLTHALPIEVHRRLQRNLEDNTWRIQELFIESVAIQASFTQVGLLFAVLKGFSLWPDSVSRLELRSQLDLDFLIAEEDATRARSLLEARGYRLMAISGRSWEFKTADGINSSMEGLYKTGCSRSVELHLEPDKSGHSSLLRRVVQRQLSGVWMPVLSQHDLLLGQAMHLYKHLCSEFTRAAHLLEFRRHVLARSADDQFWHRLEDLLEATPDVCIRIGVVIQLITSVMGEFAPPALTLYTVSRVPPLALRWIDAYAYQIALASFPGSKLYLLLEQSLVPAGIAGKRSLREALIPRRLPPSAYPVTDSETFSERIRRYSKQLAFVCFRLRFHVIEGLRFYRESLHFQQRRNEPAK